VDQAPHLIDVLDDERPVRPERWFRASNALLWRERAEDRPADMDGSMFV